jgi:hypothetical protein
MTSFLAGATVKAPLRTVGGAVKGALNETVRETNPLLRVKIRHG